MKTTEKYKEAKLEISFGNADITIEIQINNAIKIYCDGNEFWNEFDIEIRRGKVAIKNWDCVLNPDLKAAIENAIGNNLDCLNYIKHNQDVDDKEDVLISWFNNTSSKLNVCGSERASILIAIDNQDYEKVAQWIEAKMPENPDWMSAKKWQFEEIINEQ